MHETIHVGGMNITFLQTRHETADALDAFELTIPPAASVIVPHTHLHYDEWILGMDGITTWTMNGEILLLHPGESLSIPRGAPHFFANLHDKRIVEMADGELFYVITNGRNLMGPYGANVTVEDRWAIVAYLRALQIARLGSADDLPPNLQGDFKK